MTHIEFQVEEPSMEALLDGLLPRLIGTRASWKVINYGSKHRLLKSLPARMRGYQKRLEHESMKVFVLVDQDKGDCHDIKRWLDDVVIDVGLRPKTQPRADGDFHVVNRIVVQELEAWYFGDIRALRSVYPRLSEHLGRKASYRDPDRIVDTWEALERELGRVGYQEFSKIALARKMGQRLDPVANIAKSFACFQAALQSVI
jgi:Domain of unknown function (DUF4276)